MNKNDSGMAFSRVGKRSCRLHKIRNIESYEYPALLSRQAEQLSIVERLQRSIARCGNYVMSTLPKPNNHRRWDVSVKQGSIWHLGACHFQPWQLFSQLFRSLVIQLKKSVNLLRISFSVCSRNLNRYRR